MYSAEFFATSEKPSSAEVPQESTTEVFPSEFYPIETTVSSNLEFYEPSQEDHQQQQYTQTKEEEIDSLEHLFTRTEVCYIDFNITKYQIFEIFRII